MRLRIGTNGACNIKAAVVYSAEYWTRSPVTEQCSATAPPPRRLPLLSPPPLLQRMICNSIMTSEDRNSCYLYYRALSAARAERNKIHEAIVTFMRGIGKKYCVNKPKREVWKRGRCLCCYLRKYNLNFSVINVSIKSLQYIVDRSTA